MSTQIVFVGHHKEKLLDSIKALRDYPVRKIVLAIGKQESSGERKARKIAEELAQELGSVWDVEVVEVDKKDVMKAALQLVSLIKREGKVILNISGSLRTFAIAAYIAACITNSRIITSIPKYDESDREIGIEEIVEIPVLPVEFPGKEQMEIMNAVDDGVNSLDELVLKLNPELRKGSKEFKRERSRVSHHLAKLEEAGFVKREKMGRNVRVEPTLLGKIVVGVMACQSFWSSMLKK